MTSGTALIKKLHHEDTENTEKKSGRATGALEGDRKLGRSRIFSVLSVSPRLIVAFVDLGGAGALHNVKRTKGAWREREEDHRGGKCRRSLSDADGGARHRISLLQWRHRFRADDRGDSRDQREGHDAEA